MLDNYYDCGGNLGNPSQDDFTLNELCVATNHDPDGDTGQTCINGLSCWETIAQHPTRALVAPLGAPNPTPPSIPAPSFVSLDPVSRFVLSLDRSGSMSANDAGFGLTRLERAQEAAEIFANLTQDGDWLGVTSFDCTAATEFGLEVVSPTTKADGIVEIYGLSPGGGTAIGAGLAQSRDLLLTQAAACNQPIILFTDGFQTCGPSEASVIDSLIENGIPVTTVAIGSAPQQDLLQDLAQQTGSQFQWVESAEDLPSLSPFIYAAVASRGVISVAEGEAVVAPTLFTTSPVDVGAREVTFVLNWTNPAVDYDLAVVSPGGAVFDSSSALGNPNVDFFAGARHEILRIRGAAVVPGDWQSLGSSLGGGATSYQLVAIADRADVTLSASTDRPTYDPGDSIVVRATPRFDGRAVAPALVTAIVVRPGGTAQPLSLFRQRLGRRWRRRSCRRHLHRSPAVRHAPRRLPLPCDGRNPPGTTTVGGETLFDSVGDVDVILPVPAFRRHADVTAVVGSFPCGFSTYGETMPGTHSLVLAGSGGTDIGTTLDAITTGPATGAAATSLSLAPASVPFFGGTLLVSPQKLIKTRFFPAYAGVALLAAEHSERPGLGRSRAVLPVRGRVRHASARLELLERPQARDLPGTELALAELSRPRAASPIRTPGSSASCASVDRPRQEAARG